MDCDEVRAKLVDYAEGLLPDAEARDLEASLANCEDCQSDLAAIAQFRTMATNWHDEVPKAWTIPALDRPSYLEQFFSGFRQWFPTFASATALVLVTVMYVQPPVADEAANLPSRSPADYSNLPELPQATQAAFDNVLQNDRELRKQELQSLLEILTAEMNRRSLETEDSLRFLVSSQIEGQRELDHLYKQVEQLLSEQDTQSQNSGGGEPVYDRLFEGVKQ